MKTTHSLVVLALLLLACASTPAGDYAGSYVLTTPQGTMTLTLSEQADGRIVGTLADGVATIELAGQPERPRIVGDAVVPGGGRLGFALKLDDSGQLRLEFFPYDASGQPIVAQTQVLLLARQHGQGTTATGQAQATGGANDVYINRVRLEPELVRAMELQYQTPMAPGRYWYDSACGAWGLEGGPTAGFVVAGLSLPGPMPADISGGGTGIFINGREVHVLDQAALQQIFGTTIPGRYWLDAAGNLGLEGGPALVNLAAAIQAARGGQGEGGAVYHGHDSTYGARGALAGGIYSGRTASGKSVLWYPGM